jgi:hypothetical protein
MNQPIYMLEWVIKISNALGGTDDLQQHPASNEIG